MPEAAHTDAFRQSLVAAVQAELHRHATAITAEIQQLRQEHADERERLRREVHTQLGSFAALMEEIQDAAAAHLERQKSALEAQIFESESRQSRRIDDVTAGISASVQAAAKPILAEATAEQERVSERIVMLETQLRKFDEQAARMVTHVNDLIERVEARSTEVVQELQDRFAAEVAVLRPLVDEIDSSVRRFQSDVGAQVATRLNDAEDRFNSRLMAAEARMKEATGAQVAEIQAHVGRVNANIDDTLAVLNNRHEAVTERFTGIERRLDELQESVQGIDQRALDELREKMSSAVGEAMLVRIEMERMEKALNERTDTLTVRVTDVETQLAENVMDVSTAIQLDRLEELERAVLELDPTRFQPYNPAAPALPGRAGSENEEPPPSAAVQGMCQETLNPSLGDAEEVSAPGSGPFAPPRA